MTQSLNKLRWERLNDCNDKLYTKKSSYDKSNTRFDTGTIISELIQEELM